MNEQNISTRVSIVEKLCQIQSLLKAPKGKTASLGAGRTYKYRSLEDIVESAKPLLSERGLILILSDSIELIGDRTYVKATASVTDGLDTMSVSAYACEGTLDSKDPYKIPVPEVFKDSREFKDYYKRPSMSPAQSTGSTSSYARKYACNGLFAIDDTRDDDAQNDVDYTGDTSLSLNGSKMHINERSTQTGTQTSKDNKSSSIDNLEPLEVGVNIPMPANYQKIIQDKKKLLEIEDYVKAFARLESLEDKSLYCTTMRDYFESLSTEEKKILKKSSESVPGASDLIQIIRQTKKGQEKDAA